MSNIENRSDNYPSALNSGTTIYTIQPGDTLSKIAKITGKDIPTLMLINGIKDANKIRAGKTIYITKEAKAEAEAAVERVAVSQRRAVTIRDSAEDEDSDDASDASDTENISQDYLSTKNTIFMKIDSKMNESDKLGFLLFIIRESGNGTEGYSGLSDGEKIAILKRYATPANYTRYKLATSNELAEQALRDIAYRVGQENIKGQARIAEGGKSSNPKIPVTWGRETRT